MSLTAFTGANLVDVESGTITPHATVLTDGGRIVAAGASAAVPAPSEATVVDVAGRYLLPGFMDGNVHLVPWPSWTYIEFLARYEDRFHEVATEAAQLALKAGFTTVFDSMGPLDALVRARDAIDDGTTVGARIRAAGNIVGFRAVFTSTESMASASKAFQKRINDRFEAGGGPDLCWMSPKDLYAAMSDYVDQGVDFVKYGATGDGEPRTSEIGQSAVLRFSPDQQRALVQAVHDKGITVQTHTTSAESLHVAVAAGIDNAQHAAHTGRSRIYDETIELMLSRPFFCGTQWGPLDEEARRIVAERDWNRPFPSSDGLESLENAVRLIEAGVPQFVSTDAGTIDPDVFKDDDLWGGLGGQAGVIGEGEFLNMQGMADRGMSPLQIVQAATVNIARAYRVDDELGTIAPGKHADFTLLDADPLERVENMRTVSMVVKAGAVVDRDALPNPLVLSHPAAQDPGAIRVRA